MHDPIAAAAEAAAEGGAPAQVWHVGPEATIQLAEGTGHLLEDATITHWTRD